MRKKLIITGFILSCIAVGHASDIVYRYKNENGSVVFSQEKPKDSISYTVLTVTKPMVIDNPNKNISNIVKENKLKQQALEIDGKEDKNEKDSKGNISLSIITPSDGQGIFTKYQQIEIQTSPKLKETDKPSFIVNDSATSGNYSKELKAWTIPRPNPGTVRLSISGKTKSGKKINSKTITFYIHNGWLQQTKNNKANNS